MKTCKKIIFFVLASAIIFVGAFFSNTQVKADDLHTTELELRDTWTPGEIATEGAVNFYSITIPSDGWLKVSYQGWSIKDSGFSIMNYDMTKTYAEKNVWSSSSNDPITENCDLALEKGTYIVKVYSYYNHPGDYRIKATFRPANNNEKTVNDDFATAESLSKNSPVTGFFSMDDTVDFFRIDLSSRQRVRLLYTSYLNESCMKIYDKDCLEVFSKNVYSASEGNPVVYEYEETLEPGIYYIKIYPGYSCYGRYSIQYKDKIIAKSMTIRASKTNITAGQKTTLSAKITPSNASDKSVRWLSGNFSIASIDEYSGVVTTYRAGVVNFTATALDGSNISKTYTLVIKPKNMSAPSLYSGRAKQLNVSYPGQDGVKGYQIQYSTSSNFKGAKNKKTGNTYTTLKNLKRHKRYYVRVRAYIKKGSQTYYGNWSSKKKMTVK